MSKQASITMFAIPFCAYACECVCVCLCVCVCGGGSINYMRVLCQNPPNKSYVALMNNC